MKVVSSSYIAAYRITNKDYFPDLDFKIVDVAVSVSLYIT